MEDKPCTSKEANKLHQGDRTSKSRESTVCRGGKDFCVAQCKIYSRRNPELSFHKIPKDSTSKKKWLVQPWFQSQSMFSSFSRRENNIGCKHISKVKENSGYT